MKRFVGMCLAGLATMVFSAPVDAAAPLNAVALSDAPEGNAGGARVRVLHASPDAPAVDVWVSGSKVFSEIEFEESTSFVEVPAGIYNVQVVPAGLMEPAGLAVWRKRDKANVVRAGYERRYRFAPELRERFAGAAGAVEPRRGLHVGDDHCDLST